MFGFSVRRLGQVAITATAVVSLALLSTAVAVAEPAAAAAPTPGYAGDAYGSSVSVNGVVTSGKSALITFGCATPAGFHTQNTVATVNAAPVVTTGTATTTGDTSASPIQTVTSATTENISLLGGLVTAVAIRSRSTASQNPGFATSAAGTTFTNLSVLGLPVAINPAPNTRIDLPGIGFVVVNEQIRAVGANSAALTVNGLHVVVNQVNLLGIAVGTNAVVSHARSVVTKPKAGFLSGVAYGSQVKVGTLLTSGPSFPQFLACVGTNGVVKSNTGVGINVPGVVSSGTIVDTAQGTVTATTATAQMTSTVENVNLLGGLVTATGVKAVATATRANGATAVNDTGSTFATITVNGQPLVVADIAPNTAINIAGVGVLRLHRTIVNPTQIEVRMLELTVTQQVGGVVPGTVVQVAVARVAARG